MKHLRLIGALALLFATSPAAGVALQQPDSVYELARTRRAAVTFDVVRLYGVDGKTLVELYVRLPAAALPFVGSGKEWVAPLRFAVVARSGKDVVLRDEWSTTKHLRRPDMLGSPRVYFLETPAFLLPPGEYELEAMVSDSAGRRLGAFRTTLESPAFAPAASDLLLAWRIDADPAPIRTAAYDPARKNGVQVKPNPAQVYYGAPFLFYYYEIAGVLPTSVPVVRTVRVRDGTGAVVRELRSRETVAPGWGAEVGALPIGDLEEGAYTIEVAWEESEELALPSAYTGLALKKDFLFVHPRAPGAGAPDAAARSGTDDGRPGGGAPEVLVR